MKSLFSMVVLNYIWIICSLCRPLHNSHLSFPHSGDGQGFLWFLVIYFLCLDSCYTALFIIIILGLADISTPHFWMSVLSRNCLSGFPDLFCVSVSFAAVAFHLSLPGFPRLSALCSCLWTHPLFFLGSYTSLWPPGFTLPFYNCLSPLSEHSQLTQMATGSTISEFSLVFFALANSECNLPPLYCMSPDRSLSQGLRLWFSQLF